MSWFLWIVGFCNPRLGWQVIIEADFVENILTSEQQSIHFILPQIKEKKKQGTVAVAVKDVSLRLGYSVGDGAQFIPVKAAHVCFEAKKPHFTRYPVRSRHFCRVIIMLLCCSTEWLKIC